MARLLVLALLLLLGTASALAQNATSSSTGENANTTAISSTGASANTTAISSSTGTQPNATADNSSSSTGADAIAAAVPETEKTYWRKSYDWLFFSDWGRFTLITSVLGLIFLISLKIYLTKRRANAARKLADAVLKEQEQATTEGRVTFSEGFRNTVPMHDGDEAEEGDASALPAYFDHPSKYAPLGSK